MTDDLVAQVRDALRLVIDPELGHNIVDLGFVYAITVDDGCVRILMTATTKGCPAANFLKGAVAASASRVVGVRSIDVMMTFEPPWTPSMIEPSTSASLGFASEPGGIVLAVHGGAGTISRSTLTPDLEAQYRGSLERALRTGHAVLAKGGTSVDAVVATVKVFEDDPLFNAGKGAVFTHEGKNELDAAIMDGRTGQAGAVAGATRVKNPIVAARAVMENSRHVLLAGRGADQFASDQKLELVDPSYFFTQHRWDQLQKAKEKDRIVLDHDGTTASDEADAERPGAAAGDRSRALLRTDSKFGTVGAVALDQHGNLAAGTSTGGLTNKLYGRVGDSPIIGAGTYADNAAVAVSCSGTGEFFMRGAVAYDIAARMKYRGASVFDAVDEAIRESLDAKNGKGGLIALDGKGNVKFGFNTEGMYRGYVRADGEPVVQIYRE